MEILFEIYAVAKLCTAAWIHRIFVLLLGETHWNLCGDFCIVCVWWKALFILYRILYLFCKHLYYYFILNDISITVVVACFINILLCRYWIFLLHSKMFVHDCNLILWSVWLTEKARVSLLVFRVFNMCIYGTFVLAVLVSCAVVISGGR